MRSSYRLASVVREWIEPSSAVIVGAASLSPALAERRDVRRGA
jgi:hypothetical protein